MRQFGLRMNFKTLFMSDEEKHSHHFDFPLLAFLLCPTNYYVQPILGPLGVLHETV